jgi:hypothetical protein
MISDNVLSISSSALPATFGFVGSSFRDELSRSPVPRSPAKPPAPLLPYLVAGIAAAALFTGTRLSGEEKKQARKKKSSSVQRGIPFRAPWAGPVIPPPRRGE